MNKTIFNNHRGETILEVILALTIITLSLVSALTLINSAIRSASNTKNRLIATNLAREGLEAVRSIRDSNWLVYSSQPRVCWNHNPYYVPEIISDCVDVSPQDGMTDYPILAEEGGKNVYYQLDLLPTSSGSLANFSWELRQTSTTDNWEDFQLYLEDGLYTHRSDSGLGKNLVTSFARRIHFTYLDDNGLPSVSDTENRMIVTAEVQYLHNNIPRVLSLQTHLSDYLGRTDHN